MKLAAGLPGTLQVLLYSTSNCTFFLCTAFGMGSKNRLSLEVMGVVIVLPKYGKFFLLRAVASKKVALVDPWRAARYNRAGS